MKAIQTRFYGPTDTKPARIRAWTEGHSLNITYGSEQTRLGQSRHRAAAEDLANALKWEGDLLGGCLPNGDYAFIFDDPASRE